MQDELWSQAEAEAACHFKTVFRNALENTPEGNFICVTLPTCQESFYGSSRFGNFVRAVLRCKWTCRDVVFECSGFNASLGLHNCFKDYVGHWNCFVSRIRYIFPYKISVFNPLTGRKYMFTFVDSLNESNVEEEAFDMEYISDTDTAENE